MTARKLAPSLIGHDKPRLAPPVPARYDRSFAKASRDLGITLMPWQDTASRYLTATGPDGRHLYREVAIVVSRQQGKTTLMKPVIVRALKAGKRVMHIADKRELPRVMFSLIASNLDESLFPKRRGKGGKLHTIWPRYGSGQEEILLANDGWYRIAASSSGGARGWSTDLIIFDEMRQMTSFDPIDAAQPTQMMSDDPQTIYLSNAGTDASVVLNSIRKRAGEDPSLAYLEWSASPERAADDREGWAEANPAIGHHPQVLTNLEETYRSHLLGGTMASFETENLCRWVVTTLPRFVLDEAFASCESSLEEPTNPVLGVSLDPAGKRASAVLAWARPDGTIGLRPEREYTGDPIDVLSLSADVKDLARTSRAARIGYSKISDGPMVVDFPKATAVDGRDFEIASQTFAQLVAGRGLRWDDADGVLTSDLHWTGRKTSEELRTFHAIRIKDDRPVTSVQAAVRAVWLVSQRLSSGQARIY